MLKRSYICYYIMFMNVPLNYKLNLIDHCITSLVICVVALAFRAKSRALFASLLAMSALEEASVVVSLVSLISLLISLIFFNASVAFALDSFIIFSKPYKYINPRNVYRIQHLILQLLVSTKRSYIFKQTCSF